MITYDDISERVKEQRANVEDAEDFARKMNVVWEDLYKAADETSTGILATIVRGQIESMLGGKRKRRRGVEVVAELAEKGTMMGFMVGFCAGLSLGDERAVGDEKAVVLRDAVSKWLALKTEVIMGTAPTSVNLFAQMHEAEGAVRAALKAWEG